MNRLLLTLTAALLASMGAWSADVTDVTALYIRNASFEADNVSSLSPVKNSADGLRG